jgi:hypothetical protein
VAYSTFVTIYSQFLYKAKRPLAPLGITTVFIDGVKTFIFLLVAFLMLTIAWSSPVNMVTVRVHGEGIGDNSSVPVVLVNGKKSQLSIQPFLTESDVLAFYPFKATDSKTCGAYLQLTPIGEKKFKKHSIKNKGKVIAVLINGRQVADLKIEHIPANGIFLIPNGMTMNEEEKFFQAFPLMGGNQHQQMIQSSSQPSQALALFTAFAAGRLSAPQMPVYQPAPIQFMPLGRNRSSQNFSGTIYGPNGQMSTYNGMSY